MPRSGATFVPSALRVPMIGVRPFITSACDNGSMEMPEVMRTRRTELQISQAELADAADIDVRQVKRYEAGQSQPSLAVARAIARRLRISLDELAGDPPTPAPYTGTWWCEWRVAHDGTVRRTPQRIIARQQGSIVRMEASQHASVPGPGGQAWRADLTIHSENMMIGKIRSLGPSDTPTATAVLTRIEGWPSPCLKARWMAIDPHAQPQTGSGLLAPAPDILQELIEYDTEREAANAAHTRHQP